MDLQQEEHELGQPGLETAQSVRHAHHNAEHRHGFAVLQRASLPDEDTIYSAGR